MNPYYGNYSQNYQQYPYWNYPSSQYPNLNSSFSQYPNMPPNIPTPYANPSLAIPNQSNPNLQYNSLPLTSTPQNQFKFHSQASYQPSPQPQVVWNGKADAATTLAPVTVSEEEETYEESEEITAAKRSRLSVPSPLPSPVRAPSPPTSFLAPEPPPASPILTESQPSHFSSTAFRPGPDNSVFSSTLSSSSSRPSSASSRPLPTPSSVPSTTPTPRTLNSSHLSSHPEPPSFLPQSSVSPLNASSTSRGLITKESGPRLFLSLCAFLSRKCQAGVRISNCAWPRCDKPTPKGNNFTFHLLRHFGKPTLICDECGARMTVTAFHHRKAAHDGKKTPFTDNGARYDSQLVEVTRTSYREAGDSAFVLATPGVPHRLLAALASLPKPSLSCQLCRQEIFEVRTEHTLLSESHVYTHLTDGPPLFSCEQCRYSGHDILAHCSTAHDNALGMRSSGFQYAFTDQRKEREMELIELARRCFPDMPEVAEEILQIPREITHRVSHQASYQPSPQPQVVWNGKADAATTLAPVTVSEEEETYEESEEITAAKRSRLSVPSPLPSPVRAPSPPTSFLAPEPPPASPILTESQPSHFSSTAFRPGPDNSVFSSTLSSSSSRPSSASSRPLPTPSSVPSTTPTPRTLNSSHLSSHPEPPSFLPQSSVSPLNASSTSRGLITKESGPRLFLSLCAFLSRKCQAGVRISNCAWPRCDKPTPKGNNFTFHLLRHFGKPTLICDECGARMTVTAFHHRKAAHDGKKTPFTDNGARYDSQLVEVTRTSYREAGDSAFVLATPGVPHRLLAALASLPKPSLSCQLCRQEIFEVRTEHTLLSESHVYTHLTDGPPLFSCEQCRYSGHDILAHCSTAHDNALGMRSSGFQYAFTDQRKEREMELIELARRCFPDMPEVAEEILQIPREITHRVSHQSPPIPEPNQTANQPISAPKCKSMRVADGRRADSEGSGALWYHAYTLLLSQMAKSGFPLPNCRFPGKTGECGMDGAKRANYHIICHFNRPLEECSVCGYRSKWSTDSHFRTAHPEAGTVMRVDLRPNEETRLIATLIQCYPLLKDVRSMYRFLRGPDAKEPLELWQALDSAVGSVCARCPESGKFENSYDAAAHLLGHAEEGIFQCNGCRYEGNALFEHVVTDHWKGKGRLVFRFEDSLFESQPSLLVLFEQCFPDVERLPLTSTPTTQTQTTGIVPPSPNTSALPTDSHEVSMSAGRLNRKQSRKALTLMAWNTFIRQMDRAGYPMRMCHWPGCGYTAGGKMADGFRVESHVLVHFRRPVEECGVCGFRSNDCIDNHFRKAHPEIKKIDMIDLRGEQEEGLLKTLFQCFPQARSIRSILGTILDDVKEELSSALEALTREDRVCGECGVEVSGLTYDLALHLFGHSERPLFDCQTCRYEGSDPLGHSMSAHFALRQKFSVRVDSCLDEELSQLLSLLERCFPAL